EAATPAADERVLEGPRGLVVAEHRVLQEIADEEVRPSPRGVHRGNAQRSNGCQDPAEEAFAQHASLSFPPVMAGIGALRIPRWYNAPARLASKYLLASQENDRWQTSFRAVRWLQRRPATGAGDGHENSHRRGRGEDRRLPPQGAHRERFHRGRGPR